MDLGVSAKLLLKILFLLLSLLGNVISKTLQCFKNLLHHRDRRNVELSRFLDII